MQAKPANEGNRGVVRTVNRTLAWLVLAAIVVLSLVPPGARPSTVVPHKFEHAGIFLVDGLAFGIAYWGHARLLSLAAVMFCAGIELAQLTVPGRHARLSDFVVDAIAVCAGIVAGSTWMRHRRKQTLPAPPQRPRRRSC